MSDTWTWEEALQAYSYPVNLAAFKNANEYPSWFETNTDDGGLNKTTTFEDRFRKYAPHSIEAWYEVVFWKMFSQEGRRDARTKGVIKKITDSGVTADTLWRLCKEYMVCQDVASFRKFRRNFFSADVVAIVATFPAFIDPQNFPMIDKHVADWARFHRNQHDYTRHGGPALSKPPKFTKSITVLRLDQSDHREFVASWIEWCRFVARILSCHTDRHWRARDVEMAVFTTEICSKELKPLFP